MVGLEAVPAKLLRLSPLHFGDGVVEPAVGVGWCQPRGQLGRVIAAQMRG